MPSKKRTASFKYCSRRRKPGCLRAKKSCSYRKGRTPKCQPKGSKKGKKSSRGKRSKKSGSKKMKPESARSARNPPLKKQSKKCRKLKSIDGCNKEPECAYDPRKNPKCDVRPTQKKIEELFVEYKKMKFNYPITKLGLMQGMFVALPGTKDKDGNMTSYYLYLRYSKMLLHSMKPKYSKMLRTYWANTGEEAQEKYQKALQKKYGDDDQWQNYIEAMSYRIGDPLKLNLADYYDQLSLPNDEFWYSMEKEYHELKPLDEKKKYKADYDEDGEELHPDDDGSDSSDSSSDDGSDGDGDDQYFDAPAPAPAPAAAARANQRRGARRSRSESEITKSNSEKKSDKFSIEVM